MPVRLCLRCRGTTVSLEFIFEREERGRSTTKIRNKNSLFFFNILSKKSTDWIDGLETYDALVLGRGWLGGWALPQERSYFSLRLPQGWWLLALDTALNGDIDAAQLRYFGRVASERMGPDDAAIVVTHAPGWLVEWHIGEKAGANVAALIGCVFFEFFSSVFLVFFFSSFLVKEKLT